MYWHCAALDILMVFWVVYQLGNFLCSNHFWAVTKHKQHSINDIGFSTAVGANNGREVLKNKHFATDIWESTHLYNLHVHCVLLGVNYAILLRLIGGFRVFTLATREDCLLEVATHWAELIKAGRLRQLLEYTVSDQVTVVYLSFKFTW